MKVGHYNLHHLSTKALRISKPSCVNVFAGWYIVNKEVRKDNYLTVS
jgi:hypothetical protein